MQLGMVGLGRMGANMVRRLQRGGHECVVFDLNPENVQNMVKEGARGATSLQDLARQLSAPRAVWVMVPAGGPTENTVTTLAQYLVAGDTVIDGGNSYYKDDVHRSKLLAEKKIDYLDAGTSGGLWGLERGYCLMVGGARQAFDRLEPIFRTLAPGKGDIPRTPERPEGQGTAEDGYLYCGPSGAGHFVKMIHNGIEYGIMQAYAEGFEILSEANSKQLPEDMRYELDVAEISELWRRGSVIGSWLLDLTAMALAEDPKLERYTGFVEDSGEGRWTVQAAIEEAVAADVLTTALFRRFRSRKDHTFGEKTLSAMRQKFGGHVEHAKGGK
jgi:6-phosphogluconate dehydrogenase